MDRVNETTGECFSALIQLKRLKTEDLPAPELLHQKFRSFLDALVQKAGQAGFGPQDTQDMLYAMAAVVDETALAAPEPLRTFWMGNLLQYHYFQENLAGDGFFARLTPLRNDVRRAEVLRVYYLCLLFGFQGRYRVRGGELELMSLVESVQHELLRGRQLEPDSFSPDSERPETNALARPRNLSLIAASAAALAVALLVFGGLRIALSSAVHSAAEDISALSRK